jgi:hypothetical protein
MAYNKLMNYLLTLSSHTKGMPRFLESLKNINVEHIAIQFNPVTSNLKSYVHHDIPYPGHIQKYAFVPRDLDPERYVVFTDTDDVIFQKDFEEFDSDLHLAPENVIHKGSWWEPYIKQNPVFSDLLDKGIYNSGCWAMKVKHLYDLLDHQQKIGSFGNLCQCYFNSFIHSREDLSRNEDLSVFCALHANIHRKDVYKEDGIWKFRGKVITCVHANGSLKEYL